MATRGRHKPLDTPASVASAAVNVNAQSVETCVDWFVRAMHVSLPAWCEDVDVAFIESQPRVNMKTKVLSHVLQALLVPRVPCVTFVSPHLKLRPLGSTMLDHDDTVGGGRGYTANKSYAVHTTRGALSASTEHAPWLAYFEASPKRDDLADALLQGLHAASEFLRTEARALRRKTAPVREHVSVLSVDVGMKHLALCRVRVRSLVSFTIQRWEVVDVVGAALTTLDTKLDGAAASRAAPPRRCLPRKRARMLPPALTDEADMLTACDDDLTM